MKISYKSSGKYQEEGILKIEIPQSFSSEEKNCFKFMEIPIKSFLKIAAKLRKVGSETSLTVEEDFQSPDGWEEVSSVCYTISLEKGFIKRHIKNVPTNVCEASERILKFGQENKKLLALFLGNVATGGQYLVEIQSQPSAILKVGKWSTIYPYKTGVMTQPSRIWMR